MTSISSRAALSLVAALGLAIRLGVLRRPRKEATALLIIDAQKAFDDVKAWGGARNNPDAEKNIARLIAAFRAKGHEVIHVKHDSDEEDSPLRPERPGNAFKEEAEPAKGEYVFSKSVNSAFIGTTLEKYLRTNSIKNLVIAGFTTNHCVSTTTRMAGNFGFKTTLVHDACAAFQFKDSEGVISAETMHRIGLAEIRDEFAAVKSTADVIKTL